MKQPFLSRGCGLTFCGLPRGSSGILRDELSTIGFFQSCLVSHSITRVISENESPNPAFHSPVKNPEIQKAMTSARCQTKARLLALEQGWRRTTLMQGQSSCLKGVQSHRLSLSTVFTTSQVPKQELLLSPFRHSLQLACGLGCAWSHQG